MAVSYAADESQQPQQENANQNAIVSASEAEADNKKQTKRGTEDKQHQPTESLGKQSKALPYLLYVLCVYTPSKTEIPKHISYFVYIKLLWYNRFSLLIYIYNVMVAFIHRSSFKSRTLSFIHHIPSHIDGKILQAFYRKK